MKNIIMALILWMFSTSLIAQSGKVYDNLSMKSDLLKTEKRYAVYLPPDYDTSERSYPVLYLLHGGGDDQTGWIQFGEVMHIADNAIKEGTATPMIIVMPDASSGKRGFFNMPDGPYEDFFFEELIPHVEKKFRIKGEKRYRAVSGLSMGGGASFMYALHHPELFSSSCPLSAYVGALYYESFKSKLDPEFTNFYKGDELRKYYQQHNPLYLIENGSVEDVKSVRWFIDCGDDDFCFEVNSLVHIEMKKKKIPHEYRVRDGKHSWTYWRESLPMVLEFVSQAFHQY